MKYLILSHLYVFIANAVHTRIVEEAVAADLAQDERSQEPWKAEKVVYAQKMIEIDVKTIVTTCIDHYDSEFDNYLLFLFISY